MEINEKLGTKTKNEGFMKEALGEEKEFICITLTYLGDNGNITEQKFRKAKSDELEK